MRLVLKKERFLKTTPFLKYPPKENLFGVFPSLGIIHCQGLASDQLHYQRIDTQECNEKFMEKRQKDLENPNFPRVFTPGYDWCYLL